MDYLIDGAKVEAQRYEECLWGEIFRQEAASAPNEVNGWSEFKPHEQGLVVCYRVKERFTELKTLPRVDLFSVFEQINENQESE
jgi:hypothetical protein